MVKKITLLFLLCAGCLTCPAQNMQQVLQIGHENEILGVQVLPESNLILSFDESKSILWEYNSGRKINEFMLFNDRRTELHGALAIPEKNLLIASVWHSDKDQYTTLEWYTLDQHKFLFSKSIPVPDDTTGQFYALNSMHLSSDHKILYTACAGHMFVLDAENGRLINTLQIPVNALPEFTINEADEFFVYSLSRSKGLKMVWWNTRGKIKAGQNKQKDVTDGSATISHNRKWIAVGTQNGEVWLMNASDGSILKKFRLTKDMDVRDVYFTGDDKYILAKCFQETDVMKINRTTGEITAMPFKSGTYTSLRITEVPGKRQFLACNYKSFNLYDEETGILLKSYESPIGQSFHLENNRDGSLLLIDGEMLDLNTLKSQSSEAYGDDIAFDPNSSGYYAPKANEIHLYSGRGRKEEVHFAATEKNYLSNLAISSDGMYLSAYVYETRKMLFFRQGDTSVFATVPCNKEKVKATGFLPGTHNAWFILDDNKISVFNLDSSKSVITFSAGDKYQLNSTLAYDARRQIIAYPEIINGNRISFYSFKEKKYVFTFYDTLTNYANYIQLDFNPKTRHWIALKSDAILQILNDSFVCIGQKNYGEGANSISLDTVAHKIYLASDGGYINCYTYDTLESELTFQYQIVSVKRKDKGREFVFRTLGPGWYYFAPKTAVAAFHYVNGFQTYPYDQFDFALNQPAEVLKKAGSSLQWNKGALPMLLATLWA